VPVFPPSPESLTPYAILGFLTLGLLYTVLQFVKSLRTGQLVYRVMVESMRADLLLWRPLAEQAIAVNAKQGEQLSRMTDQLESLTRKHDEMANLLSRMLISRSEHREAA